MAELILFLLDLGDSKFSVWCLFFFFFLWDKDLNSGLISFITCSSVCLCLFDKLRCVPTCRQCRTLGNIDSMKNWSPEKHVCAKIPGCLLRVLGHLWCEIWVLRKSVQRCGSLYKSRARTKKKGKWEDYGLSYKCVWYIFTLKCIKKKKLVSYVEKYDLVSSVVGSLWYIILKVV